MHACGEFLIFLPASYIAHESKISVGLQRKMTAMVSYIKQCNFDISKAYSIISLKAAAQKLQKAPRIVSSHSHWPTDVYPVTEFSNSSHHSTTPRGLLVGLGGRDRGGLLVSCCTPICAFFLTVQSLQWWAWCIRKCDLSCCVSLGALEAHNPMKLLKPYTH